jgi:hypothetical protein
MVSIAQLEVFLSHVGNRTYPWNDGVVVHHRCGSWQILAARVD